MQITSLKVSRRGGAGCEHGEGGWGGGGTRAERIDRMDFDREMFLG
jgi:hypothetical protein